MPRSLLLILTLPLRSQWRAQSPFPFSQGSADRHLLLFFLPLIIILPPFETEEFISPPFSDMIEVVYQTILFPDDSPPPSGKTVAEVSPPSFPLLAAKTSSFLLPFFVFLPEIATPSFFANWFDCFPSPFLYVFSPKTTAISSSSLFLPSRCRRRSSSPLCFSSLKQIASLPLSFLP